MPKRKLIVPRFLLFIFFVVVGSYAVVLNDFNAAKQTRLNQVIAEPAKAIDTILIIKPYTKKHLK